MVVKTITVTKKAYDSLKLKKTKTESFSETILRLTTKGNIMDFVGILSTKEADELETIITENRKKQRSLQKKRMKHLQEAF